jgi:hypothetical protein
MAHSSTGTLWFLPTQNVFQPGSRSTSATAALSIGMWPVWPGKPWAPSAIWAKPFWWWLRPVRKHDRVGEHSAVVCHCEYVSPSSASRCIVGISMRPP